jgi:hydroxylamine reductase
MSPSIPTPLLHWVRDGAKVLYQEAAAKAGLAVENLDGPALFEPAQERESLLAQGRQQLINISLNTDGKELKHLEERVIYGLKGVSAYSDHAMMLGSSAPARYAIIYELMNAHAEEQTIEELLGLALKVGELNFNVLEQLDHAHTETFGSPTPTALRIHPVKGKAILVSGHDLHDL